MLKQFLIVALVVSCVAGCSKPREEELKEQRTKGAEMVENKAAVAGGVGDALKKEGADAAKKLVEGVGNVVKGAAEGVDKAESSFALELNESAANKQLSAQRATLATVPEKGEKGIKVYVMSKTAYTGTLQLRALDKEGVEVGRSKKADAKLGADDAAYIEFHFDDATPFSRVQKFVVHAL